MEDVEGWVSSAFAKEFGEYSQWSHVMFVYPRSVLFGKAAAIGYYGWSVTVFQSGHEDILLVQMHEMGHNMRMGHSGIEGGSSCKLVL